MTNPQVAVRYNTNGTFSLVGINETYPHREAFRAAGYDYAEAQWEQHAQTQADLARLMVAAHDAGFAVYQANRTTAVTADHIERARKQLAQ